MTKIDARFLKLLYGEHRSIAGCWVRFDGQRQDIRAGGEGYVAPVVVESAGPGQGSFAPGEKLMLKVYKQPSPERRERVGFLSSIGLRELLPVFFAAPCAAVTDVIAGPRSGGDAAPEVLVEGLLCPYVDGQGFNELLARDEWDAPTEARCSIALQVCNAVRVLEGGGLAHGDLSATNLMITGLGGAWPEARLIDYDGFHHPQMPLIPVTVGRDGGRGWGSDGYRHSAYRVGDSMTVVSTDRVALAALVMELVVVRPGMLQALGRDTLVDQSVVDTNCIPRLPDEAVQLWPEGHELFVEAFGASSPELAPEPERWCRALRSLAAPPAPARSWVLVVEDGSEAPRQAALARDENSLDGLSPKLSWLRYVRRGEVLELHGESESVVFVRRAGAMTRHRGRIAITVEPGDQVLWRNMALSVREGS